MSNIHYFQRYSQKENVVTNNTLLLFSRLYNESYEKFNRFLLNLGEERDIELDIKMNFRQQEKASNSIPDGHIFQKSIKIVIETKLHSQKNIKQIEEHLKEFGDEDYSIMLLINKEEYSANFISDIKKLINAVNDKILFIPTTFRKICAKFEDSIYEYDFELADIIKDYRNYCETEGLIDNRDTKIRVVLSGKTLEQNIRNSVYYAPSKRGYQDSKFLGLYKNKAIRAIGEVIDIFDVISIDDGVLKVEKIKGIMTQEKGTALINIIREAKEKYHYNIAEDHRFFFVDKFIKTEYKKISKGGSMGTRYFDLADIDEYKENMTNDEIAKMLSLKEWS